MCANIAILTSFKEAAFHMLTLCMFLVSGGSTHDIDAVKTGNTDSDNEDSEIGGKEQRKLQL